MPRTRISTNSRQMKATHTNRLPSDLKKQASDVCDAFRKQLMRHVEGTYKSRFAPKGTALTTESLHDFSESFNSNASNHLLQQSLANVPLSMLAEDRNVLMSLDFAYSHTLNKCPKATNQYSSGRCWLFAALNAMRHILIDKFHLQDTFELSEAYLFFYDKLERANMFLEKVIEFRNCYSNDPLYVGMLTWASPMCDGGTWDFFVNLVTKYGVTPKTIYDECFNSMATDEMNTVLFDKLSDYGTFIRANSRLSAEKLRKLKDEVYMPEIYSLLVKFMGEPPREFSWKFHEAGETFESVRDKGTYHVVSDLTPLVFYNNMIEPEFGASEKLTLIHDPRPTSLVYQCYSVEHFGNMVGGRPNLYHNVPLDVLKKAVAQSLIDQKPVWVGCDVGRDFNQYRDLLSVEAFQYERAIGVKRVQNKAERLNSRTSCPTHAMLIVGVDIDKDTGMYRKWRIENSWGENFEGADPGYLQMSDRWFDEYVFEVVVDPEYLDKEVLDKLMETHYNPIQFDFNDPFGAVAMLKTPNSS